MKTIAIFKWATNPDDAIVRADGSINWDVVRPEVGDDDHMAVSCACAAAQGGEVIGLTLAGGDTAFAAARGAERTIVVDGAPVPADSSALARALADAIRGVGDVGLVAIGDSDWDPCVAPMVAGLLGWSVVTAVDAVELRDGALFVTRRFGTGTQDVLVEGPVVLDVSARREEEAKPGMRQVLAARKKPMETVSFEGSGASFASLGTRLPEAGSSRVFDGSNPEQAVEQLIGALQAEGVL